MLRMSGNQVLTRQRREPQPPAGGPEGSTPTRAFWSSIAAAVCLGLIVRFMRLDHGLPDFLEEATPLRLALGMWGWPGKADDLNPHTFAYPALTFYAHYAVQKAAFLIGHLSGRYGSAADYLLDFLTDPTPAVRVSRGLCIAADGV